MTGAATRGQQRTSTPPVPRDTLPLSVSAHSSRHNPGSWVGEQPEEEEEEEEEMEEEEEEEEEQEQQTCEPESRSGKQSPGPPAAPKRRAEPEKDAPKAAREDPPPAADEDSSHSGVGETQTWPGEPDLDPGSGIGMGMIDRSLSVTSFVDHGIFFSSIRRSCCVV